jgi:hypothetical protein
MATQRYEKRSLRTALETYLTSKGWTDLRYEENRKSVDTISNPMVAIKFVPSTVRGLQIGRVSNQDRLYVRRVQFDCYMDTESRAEDIMEDIMEFVDLVPVTVTDHIGNVLGSLICYNEESIYGEILPPMTTQPKLLRWRSITRCEMEAHFPTAPN